MAKAKNPQPLQPGERRVLAQDIAYMFAHLVSEANDLAASGRDDVYLKDLHKAIHRIEDKRQGRDVRHDKG